MSTAVASSFGTPELLYVAVKMALRAAVRGFVRLANHVPIVRDGIYSIAEHRSRFTGLGQSHPFDRRYLVATSGFVGPAGLGIAAATAYAAAQPSIVRRAIDTIPDIASRHFIDIGCGKGRPLMVASQCGFRAVTGVERNPTLVGIARRNAATFAAGGHGRTPITVLQADATTLRLPDETPVLFFYNPFGDAVMARVIANIEASLAARPRTLFVIAYNPVAAPLFDASPALERYSAETVPCSPEERGFGPVHEDAVVIWRSRGSSHEPPRPHAHTPVLVLSPMVAKLAG